MFPILLIIIGMLLLYGGAEALVHGASRLAFTLGIPPIIIGLTIVSFSTSMPEAVASFLAQLKGGRGDIALGNVIGSNISNLTIVMGFSALILPIDIAKGVKKREPLILLAVTIGFMGLLLFGEIYRWMGFLLLAVLMGYIYFQVLMIQKHKPKPKEAEADVAGIHLEKQTVRGVEWDIALIAVGVVILIVGGYLLIEGAIALAKMLNISDRVIGLTIVAVGTSCPEMATSLVAAIRGKHDIFIGNIIGSNIFNMLFIAGGVATIFPIHFSSSLLYFDSMVMLGFSLVLTGLIFFHSRLRRVHGALFLVGYTVYLVALIRF